MRITYFLLFLVYGISVQAQSNFWKSPDAYLGEKPPSDTPQIFALNLLMLKDTFAFDRVAFSEDGKEFYYPSSNTWFNAKATKIRYFKFEGGKWDGPFVLNEHFYAPTFSIDGQALYLEGKSEDTLHSVIFQQKRTAEGGWTSPSVFMKAGFGLYDFMPTKSGVYYVGSNAHQGNRRDYSTYDICELRMSATDTVVRSLGPAINTPGFDGDFYVARDESYMIVSAKETKDFECELWISFRRKDKSWTPVVSLGPLINNGVAHRWGQYVSPDGKYLFYSTGTSPANCHIVWVRFDKLLEKLRRENM
jgi:hypothetical protein